jgi:uncharacterized protein (DUF849 family)
VRCWLLLTFAGCVLLLGCQTPERAAIQPLPPDATPPPFAELAIRIQDQVEAAQKFFYRDDWSDLAEAAAALKQSAGFLARIKVEDLPDRHRTERDEYVRIVTDAAEALAKSAQTKDVNQTVEVMQTLHKTVRRMQAR